MEYVELWYFTTEGCREASKATPTAADGTIGILNTTTGLTLQPINTTRASRNATIDEHLTWEQVMTARHTLIQTAIQAGWPGKHTLALAEFYVRLEGLKAEGRNSQALLLYHATVRRQWHEAMSGRGNPFNPSIFNKALFTKLENRIRDHNREEMLRKASRINSSIQCHETDKISPPQSLPHYATQRNATSPPHPRPPHATP